MITFNQYFTLADNLNLLEELDEATQYAFDQLAEDPSNSSVMVLFMELLDKERQRLRREMNQTVNAIGQQLKTQTEGKDGTPQFFVTAPPVPTSPDESSPAGDDLDP